MKITNYAPSIPPGTLALGSGAGGDLGGTLPNPTVTGINGVTITGTLANGQTWVYDSGSGTLLPGLTGTPTGRLQTIAASGAAQTLNLSLYDVFDITLTANCTLTFTGAPAAGSDFSWTFVIRQGGSGSYTITWPAAVKWPAADGTPTTTPPALWTVITAVNVAVLSTEDGGTSYGANLVGSGSGGVPATTVTGPDAFGAAAVVGTSTNYARQDHNHGLPAAPGGEILVSDTPAGSPLVFADLLQNEAGTDLLYMG